MNQRNVRFKMHRKTAAEWAASTVVLYLGEPGCTTDTGVLKIGDGVNVWSALAAISGGSGVTDHGALTGLTDDDHTQYQKESEKDANSGYCGLDSGGKVDGDRLPAFSTTKKAGVPAVPTPSGQFLKDDGTWASPAGASHNRQHAIMDAADHTSTITPGKLIKAAATTGLPAEATNTDTEVAAAVTASHANTNDPSAGQKAALPGTSGTPSDTNRYVTDADARNTNSRTPSAHKTSHEPGGADAMTVDAAAATGSLRTLGTGATAACAGNDSRLSDARTPTSHGNAQHSSTFITISDVTGTKIDDLTQGDDNTDLNASTSRHGLAIKATAPGAGVRNVLAIDNTETAYKNAALVDDTNPAALGTAGPGTSLVAARRDHIHTLPAIDATAAATDITTRDATTSAHGLVVKATAPASGLLNVVGIANAETVYANKALYDATNPAALGTAGPGTQLVAARRDHIHTLPKLDDVAAPDDNTDLNVSTSVHGLVPKAPNNTYQMLRADGAWARPRASAYATTSSATPTPDADTYDTYELTALAEAATFGAPTGTPVNGQKLMIRILDNGTARGLTWNSIYAARGAALPSTTVQSKVHHIGFIYSSNKTKWDCVVAVVEA